jgi:predicted O-methyltransferase YrrM
MDFLPEGLNAYVEQHSRYEGETLEKLERETYLKVLMPRMVSGHIQGQTLRMLSLMIRPMNILEIGTFTGYSAICFADGLQEGGQLITIDINEELADMVQRYIRDAGMQDKIRPMIGNALDIIPSLTSTFDLVFIDADKENYSAYYDMVFEKVRPGGFILADNVLWSGKVIQPNPDKDTRALMAFNEKVQHDERVENVLFPIRDGFMVIRKK